MQRSIVLFLASSLFCFSANAAICDHAPSKIVGPYVSGLVTGGSAMTAAAGAALKAAGLYAIPNAATGAAMLGSTAAGTSAAGTVGIMSGTAGAVGAVGSALMSPFVLVPAAIVAAGVGAYEGGCHYYDSSKR